MTVRAIFLKENYWVGDYDIRIHFKSKKYYLLNSSFRPCDICENEIICTQIVNYSKNSDFYLCRKCTKVHLLNKEITAKNGIALLKMKKFI